MPWITTTLGPMDSDDLQRHDTLNEDDDRTVSTVEYCLVDCPGPAHSSHLPDAPSHFCNAHIHRSVHVAMKRWPAGALTGAQGSFT